MMQRTLALLGAGLLLTAVGSAQQNTFQKKSVESDIDFKMTNYGIFGLDVVVNNAGFKAPRGSNNTYMVGSGLWFAARKESGGAMNKLCFITYNPNSGASWATPGEGYLVATPEAGEPARPMLYHSVEYDRRSGVYNGAAVPPVNVPNWPLWLARGEKVTPLHSGTFAPYDNDRISGSPSNYIAPAFMPGVDEQFVSRFHDADPGRYEGMDQTKARMQGYPIGLQIQQNVYAWRSGLLKDAVVLEYTIINPTGQTLYDCVVGQITDPDIGSPSNDHGDFYDRRPELRTAFNWTESEVRGNYGALATTLLEAPMVDGEGFVDNSRRAEFLRMGRVGSYRNWTIEIDPTGDVGRYDFIGSGIIDADDGPGDKRAMLASGKFSMRPGDTAHFTIAYSVIPTVPVAARKGGEGEITSGGRVSLDLERMVEGLSDAYYNRDEFQPAAVPATPAGGVSRLSLLPNPARDRASIAFTLRARGTATISVANSLGEELLIRSLDGLDAGEHRQDLDLRGLGAGAYIVRVMTADGIATTKLTLVR